MSPGVAGWLEGSGERGDSSESDHIVCNWRNCLVEDNVQADLPCLCHKRIILQPGNEARDKVRTEAIDEV